MSVLSLHINSLTLLFLDSLYIFIIFYLLCFLFFLTITAVYKLILIVVRKIINTFGNICLRIPIIEEIYLIYFFKRNSLVKKVKFIKVLFNLKNLLLIF